MLIFGSTALKHWFPDLDREPKDLDYVGKGLNSKGIEYHWNDAFQYIYNKNQDTTYVDPNFLYTIKISHAAWNIHWDRTMYDIRFMKLKGCKLDHELYLLLLKDWTQIHSPKNISVTGNPEEFFKDRQFSHDKLHNLVKFYDRPLHEMLRLDPNDVKFSKALWVALSYEDQIKCALEETYVFALERYLEFPPKIAFLKALKQLITSSTKGYFNLFLIDNFFELMYYDKNKYFTHYKEVKNG